MRRFPSPFIIWAAASAIFAGINMLTHDRDPHEIIDYLGTWLLISGIAVIITWLGVSWHVAGRPLPRRVLLLLMLLPPTVRNPRAWYRGRK